jgi:hypothetical protein
VRTVCQTHARVNVDIVESQYMSDNGDYRIDAAVSKTMKNSVMVRARAEGTVRRLRLTSSPLFPDSTSCATTDLARCTRKAARSQALVSVGGDE